VDRRNGHLHARRDPELISIVALVAGLVLLAGHADQLGVVLVLVFGVGLS
jgi:hypothetical protein